MNSEDQFDALVREHYEPLFKFAMRLTRADSDARDLTQQTFYVWAMKGHQLRDSSKTKTWLFTTLHNVFLKERRRQTRFVPEDLETFADELPAPCSNVDSPGDGPEVLSALAQIDTAYRTVVSLFYLNDRSYHEIVAILGVPLGTVKSRIARGVAQLREILLSEHSSSSFPTDESSSVSGATVVLCDRHDRWASEVFAHDYLDGDLSSTLLPGTSSRLRNHTRSLPHSAVN